MIKKTSKNIKTFLSVLLALIGVLFILLGDTFTLLPIILIVLGTFLAFISLLKVKSPVFYILFFISIYFLVSLSNEAFYKPSYAEINIPAHQNKIFIVASNSFFQWRDIFFTWFIPKKFKIDFDGRVVIYLKRNIPSNINDNKLYNDGYSYSKISKQNYSYLILIPINKKIANKKKPVDYEAINQNDIRNMRLVLHKLDSLEKL